MVFLLLCSWNFCHGLVVHLLSFLVWEYHVLHMPVQISRDWNFYIILIKLQQCSISEISFIMQKCSISEISYFYVCMALTSMLLNVVQSYYQLFNTEVGYYNGGCCWLIWSSGYWICFPFYTSCCVSIYLDRTRWNILMYLIYAAILQFPAKHKKKPQRSGYRRAKINSKIAIFTFNPRNSLE